MAHPTYLDSTGLTRSRKAQGSAGNDGDPDVTSIVVDALPALAAGTNNIGDVDVLTVPADPFGLNADAAVAAGAAGSVQGKLRRLTQGVEDLKTLIVLGAGSAAIGKLAANGGVIIGDVNLSAGQTLATVTLVSTVTTLTGSSIAHDSVDSGNPHKIGAIATASVLGDTPVAAADRTNLKAGTDGVLFNRPHTSLEDIISEQKTNTDGASTAMTVGFAATASQRIYLTSLCLANSSAVALTVDIRDGAAGAVLFTAPVPAGSGFVHAFPVPLRFSANTAAAFDGSAAATTLTCSMVGFKSKA